MSKKSKRTLSDVMDASSKHPKTNGEIRNRHLEAVFNESYNSDYDPNMSLNASRNLNVSKRVSLSRQEGTRKSILPTFSKTTEEDSQNEPTQPLNPEEYRTNLCSLDEIMSKRFDPKKAFSYNFINIMNTFINNDKGHVDFKLIAGALEAGTKVYTSKVDVVYRNTQKVSSSLSMATDEKENFDEDEDALFDELNDRLEKKIKKSKRNKKNVNVIVPKAETLNGKLETNIELDPLFHHLSAAFDVGNVNSLLMANLSTDPCGVMLLDSNASLNFQQMEIIKENSFIEVKNDPFKERYISTYFADFDFSRRDISIEIQNTEEKLPNPTYTFDINAEVDDIGDMDHDNDINFGDNFPSDTEEEDPVAKGNDGNDLDADALDIETQNLIRMLPANDNQFFNKNFLKAVFKKMSGFYRPNINLNPSNNPKPRQRKERAVFQENKHCLQFDGFVANDNQRYTPTTLEKWIQQSSTFQLKNDYGFNSAELRECFLVKNTHFHDLFKSARRNQSNKESNAFEDDSNDAGEAFFDNDNDVHDDYSPIDFNQASEPLTLDQRADSGIDDEPMHIDALDIDYAKVSKKIDIKRVKRGMWEAIVKESTDTQTLFSTQPSFSQESAQESLSSQCKALTFCQLRHNLPNYINANLNDNLSVPISFVALLHLCNEKSLNLTPQDQLSDFCIQAQIPM